MASTLVIVDDHALIREGIRHICERNDEFEVVGEAATIGEAFLLLDRLRPNVVSFDAQFPDGSGIDAARQARCKYPDLGIVICTAEAGDQIVLDALQAGASAFVDKRRKPAEIVAAARHAAATPQVFTSRRLAEVKALRQSPSPVKLSPRESEVLVLLADGLGAAQIARQLYISQSTAKTHISSLYEKLGAGNRAQALMAALRAGLLQLTV